MGVGACIALFATAPVLAKMPYFSVEITPREPVAGEPIMITVRTWQDLANTVPEPFDVPDLNGLLVLRSTDGTPSIGIALEADAPGRFQGTVTVPTAGVWTLVAFPDRSGWSPPEVPPGYPDTITVTVRPETGVVGSVLIGGIAAAVGLVGLSVLAQRSGRLRRAVHRSTISMALILAVAACDAAASDPDPVVTASPPASSPAASLVTLANAEECPVTIPTAAPPEIGDQLFGSGSAHGNEDLWVGGLWPDGIIAVHWSSSFVAADGSIGMKFGWWRNVSGQLEITGRRLDGSAPPLHAGVPDGYGGTGFQASGVSFPTEGCWELTGSVGSSSLTFVTLVIKNDDA
jgi:hypothetical protein